MLGRPGRRRGESLEGSVRRSGGRSSVRLRLARLHGFTADDHVGGVGCRRIGGTRCRLRERLWLFASSHLGGTLDVGTCVLRHRSGDRIRSHRVGNRRFHDRSASGHLRSLALRHLRGHDSSATRGARRHSQRRSVLLGGRSGSVESLDRPGGGLGDGGHDDADGNGSRRLLALRVRRLSLLPARNRAGNVVVPGRLPRQERLQGGREGCRQAGDLAAGLRRRRVGADRATGRGCPLGGARRGGEACRLRKQRNHGCHAPSWRYDMTRWT